MNLLVLCGCEMTVLCFSKDVNDPDDSRRNLPGGGGGLQPRKLDTQTFTGNRERLC